MRSWTVPVVALLVCLGFLLLGIVAVGRATRQGIRDQERFTFAFDDIDCGSPPNQTRSAFLSEVQYLGSISSRLRLLDDDLAERLATAFASHPWVENVERVHILATRGVEVGLKFRQPALAVKLPAGAAPVEFGPALRVVDGRGIVLPASTSAQDLPVFTLVDKNPPGPAGQPWSNPSVAEAAGIAAILRQHKLKISSLVAAQQEWTLFTPGKTRVLWGHAIGQEASGEAPASEKAQRLARYCTQHGGLGLPDGPYEHDVRPRHQPIRRPASAIRPS